jgi:hypothetical protein
VKKNFEDLELIRLHKLFIKASNTEGLKLEGKQYIGEFLTDEFTSETPFIVNGELIGCPFNLQMLIHRYGKDFVPNCIGIYHLFSDNKLVYIGMSINIRKRLIEHLRDDTKVFNNVLWFCTKDRTIDMVLELERNMIKFHNPILNKQHSICR